LTSIAASNRDNLFDHLPSGGKTSFRPHSAPEFKVEAAIGIPQPDKPGHHHAFFRLLAGHCIDPHTCFAIATAVILLAIRIVVRPVMQCAARHM